MYLCCEKKKNDDDENNNCVAGTAAIILHCIYFPFGCRRCGCLFIPPFVYHLCK